MQVRNLLIDDMRESGFYPDVVRVCRTVDDGVITLRDHGPWDTLFLDHDMGAPLDKTGYTIICWLEENPQYWPAHIEIVTSNPSARVKMQLAIEKHDRMRDSGEVSK